MDKKQTVNEILNQLKRKYPGAKTALKFNTPFEILVATILSAQCTDERVNKVTENLFKKYKKIEDYANADLKEFEKDIHSTGFYHNKAKNIISCAKIIIDKFNGNVPRKMEDLLTLPGVARKTANIVLGNAYKIVEGIAVDTHVKRVSYRIGMTDNTDPEKIEQDLMKIIPRKYWFLASNLLIQHGREICDARNPKCSICCIKKYCLKRIKN